MPSDRELVTLLGEVWESMAQVGAQLTESEWKLPTEVPGWSVQDNLVHITGLESQLLGRPIPEHTLPDDLPHVKNDAGRRNELFVDSRRDQTGVQALTEFRDVTVERLAQLRSFGPDDFGRDSWTPVGPGTVRDLLPFRVFDSWVHEQDMRRAVQKRGDLDSAVAALSLDRIAAAMPFVVGKKAGAPDGATVVFDLGGPLARCIPIGVEGGRASLLDAAPDAPQVRIVTDTETFARVACGRVDASEALAGERVTLEGERTLGRRVLEQLNFLF